ncbi:hypothetical protein AALM99_02695, partial [Lactococcus muris]
HSTAQHSTAQHSTAQHSTAQHSTAQVGDTFFYSALKKSRSNILVDEAMVLFVAINQKVVA